MAQCTGCLSVLLNKFLISTAGGTEINGIGVAVSSTTISLSGLTFESGDTLILYAYDEDNASTLALISGWTMQLAGVDSAPRASAALYTRVSDGTETSVSISNINTGGFSVALAVAVPSSYSLGSRDSSGTNISSGGITWPAVSATNNNSLSLAFGAYGDIVTALPEASGYTLLAQAQNGTSGNGATGMVCYKVVSSGSTTPVRTDSYSDEYWSAHVIMEA